MAKNDEKRSVRCSFCGKHQDQVRRLIAGPGAYICNECVQLCMSILEDEGELTQEALESARAESSIAFLTYGKSLTV